VIHILRLWAQSVAWLVALGWVYKLLSVIRGLPLVPDLCDPQWDRLPDGMPSLTVIVPARQEAADIGATLRSLLAQDYPNLQIIAVDDRSTDETGFIIDRIAQQHPQHIRAIHVTELPAGWLGKTHAMALAARQDESDWILFIDADILFAPDSLRRALAFAVAAEADHLVTVPTLLIKRWDEGMMLGFFQCIGLWLVRPWRISDPRYRDAIGAGAFNLIRRSAYQQIGGFEALPMIILEDLALGRLVKSSGLRQRIAFAPGLVRVHWASGALGLMHVMVKNLFSGFGFSTPMLLAACLCVTIFCVLPPVGFAFPSLRLPTLIVAAASLALYWFLGRRSLIPTLYALLFPSAAVVFIVAMLQSMRTVRRQGGVTWRGTFYPLKDLKRFTLLP